MYPATHTPIAHLFISQDINRCNDMRCYFDEGDMTNCILKASPHLIFRVFSKVQPQISINHT